MNGVVAIDFYSTDARRSFSGRTLAKNYLKLFDEHPNTYMIAGAHGIALLISAMNRSENSENKQQIGEQIRRTGDFKGFIGRVNIGTTAKSKRPLIINTIKDGKLQFVLRGH